MSDYFAPAIAAGWPHRQRAATFDREVCARSGERGQGGPGPGARGRAASNPRAPQGGLPASPAAHAPAAVSTQVSRRDRCDDRTLLFPLHEGKEPTPRSILETPRNPAFSRNPNIAVPRRSHHDLQHLPFQTNLVPNALSSTTAGVGFTRAEYGRRAIVRSVGSGGKMRSGCGLRAVMVRSSSGGPARWSPGLSSG
jgi:hypothetical protein